MADTRLVIPSSEITKPAADLVTAFIQNIDSSATVHEAGKTRTFPNYLRPIAHFADAATALRVADKFKKAVIGAAVTCNLKPGDNLFIHAAVEQCGPGDVLVVGSTEPGKLLTYGNLGDLLGEQLMYRHVAGVVIDGSCRDIGPLLEMGLPVFVESPCIDGTTKKGPGNVNHPVVFSNGTSISAGDLVVFNIDGGAVVPRQYVANILQVSMDREAKEARAREGYKQGALSVNKDGRAEAIAALERAAAEIG